MFRPHTFRRRVLVRMRPGASPGTEKRWAGVIIDERVGMCSLAAWAGRPASRGAPSRHSSAGRTSVRPRTVRQAGRPAHAGRRPGSCRSAGVVRGRCHLVPPDGHGGAGTGIPHEERSAPVPRLSVVSRCPVGAGVPCDRPSPGDRRRIFLSDRRSAACIAGDGTAGIPAPGALPVRGTCLAASGPVLRFRRPGERKPAGRPVRLPVQGAARHQAALGVELATRLAPDAFEAHRIARRDVPARAGAPRLSAFAGESEPGIGWQGTFAWPRTRT